MSTDGNTQEEARSGSDLTEREQRILRFITERFIETARPIGSRSLAREHPEIDLSPASVRNTMSDLEARGYLDQPHTSAGRMPTERGYRAFVDELMERPELDAAEKRRRADYVIANDGAEGDLRAEVERVRRAVLEAAA